jgi:hypothetical protein
LIGGRTYNRPGLFAWPVDLGGEFIHGQLTHFKELCAELGVATVRTFSSFPPTPYFDDGRPVAEWLWFGQEGKLVSWVDAQRDDKDFAHVLDVIGAMEEAKDVAPGENLYQYLVCVRVFVCVCLCVCVCVCVCVLFVVFVVCFVCMLCVVCVLCRCVCCGCVCVCVCVLCVCR